MRNEGENVGRVIKTQHHRPILISYLSCKGKNGDEIESEHTCWDTKDGELCLCRMKPEETLVEVRSDTNVQIVRLTYV